MTDNLTNRIAAAIRAVDDMRVCKLSDADIKFIAAAIVEELGLHQESGLSGYHVTINPGGYHRRGTHVARYCTEWTADD